MAMDTKPNLSCEKFEQLTGDTLYLSGTTGVYNTLSILTNGKLCISDNAGLGRVFTSDEYGKGTWETISVSGDALSKEISQLSHGFVVGDVVGFSANTYNKAIADGSYDGEIIGVVSQCVDANTYKVTQAGYITGMTGLVTGCTYFVSPNIAGAMTYNEPTGDTQISKAVFLATSDSTGWVLPYVGYVVSTGTTSSGGGITGATNGLNVNSGNQVGLGGTLTGDTWIDTTNSSILGLGDCTNSNAIIIIDGTTGSGMCCVAMSASDAGGSNTSATVVASLDDGYAAMFMQNLSTGALSKAIVTQTAVAIGADDGAGTSACIDIQSAGIFVCGTLLSGFVGAQYGADYSANYTCLSIPNAGWVTGQTSGGTIISNDAEIIFNSGGTLSGSQSLLYNYSIDALEVGINSAANAQGSVAIANGYVDAGAPCGFAIGLNSYVYSGNSVAMGGGIACGYSSVAMGGGTACGNSSVAMAGGETHADGAVAILSGIAYCIGSLAMLGSQVLGDYSFAIGRQNQIYSCGSGIVGGENNYMASGNSCSVLLGGYLMNIPADTYVDTVIVPNFAIYCTPSGSGSVLCWNSITKMVELTSGGGGITGAINGLCANSGNQVGLGGTLTGDTQINVGAHTLCFVTSDATDFRMNDAGLTISSDGFTNISLNERTIGLTASASTSNTALSIQILGGNAIIYDESVGGNGYGLQYNADYSANYTNRSLVDKGYVDSVAGSSLSEFTITGDSSATGFTVNHALNKQFVMVQIVEAASPYATVYTDVQRTNANCVCVTFNTAPPSGTCYKVLIMG